MFTLRGHFYRKLARTGLVTAALPESKRVGKNVIKWNLFSSIDSKYWYSIQENWHPFSEVTLWKFWTRLSTKTENGKKENSTILVTFYVQSFPPKMSLNHLLCVIQDCHFLRRDNCLCFRFSANLLKWHLQVQTGWKHETPKKQRKLSLRFEDFQTIFAKYLPDFRKWASSSAGARNEV